MNTSVSVKIPQELDRRVRVLAAENDLNRSEFIRQALEEKVATLIVSGTDGRQSEQGPRPIACASEGVAIARPGDDSPSKPDHHGDHTYD
jgi:hypothetical protein